MWFWNEAWSTVLIATRMPVAVVNASITDWSACFGAGSEALDPSVTRPPEGPGDWLSDRHAARTPPGAAGRGRGTGARPAPPGGRPRGPPPPVRAAPPAERRVSARGPRRRRFL